MRGWPVIRGWRRGGDTLRSLTALLVLGLAFASLEVHDAAHRLPVSYTDLSVEIATSHPPLPVHVEASVGFFDLDCPACVASLQQRPAAGRAAALSAPAASGALPAGDWPRASTLRQRLPVSRGPPLR